MEFGRDYNNHLNMKNLKEQEDKTNEERIKSVLSFMVLKKLVTPINKTKAFKLGLIDFQGKQIRKPENKEEESLLTLFDKLMFRIRYLLAGRVSQLNRFIYLQTVLDDNFYDQLKVTGNINKRAAVLRVKNDIEKLVESKGFSQEEIYSLLISELVHEMKKGREVFDD